MFGRSKRKKTEAFDKTGKIPVIRSSICTGEKVAGFKDVQTGHFTEMMCIKTDADLQSFLSGYGIEESEIKREW